MTWCSLQGIPWVLTHCHIFTFTNGSQPWFPVLMAPWHLWAEEDWWCNLSFGTNSCDAWRPSWSILVHLGIKRDLFVRVYTYMISYMHVILYIYAYICVHILHYYIYIYHIYIWYIYIYIILYYIYISYIYIWYIYIYYIILYYIYISYIYVIDSKNQL